nr:capsid protein [Phomopsis vexans partitivirus 1]
MAENNNATVPAATAPAEPNRNVNAGRSGMAEFAAKLAAQHIIDDQDNERDWPITSIQLNARLLLEMFARMTFLLIRACSREMGYPTLNAQALIDLRHMANCVGWICLNNCYLVTYNKGIKILPSTFYSMNMPSINYLTFPIHIAALINSIGPIAQDGFPAKRTFIPFISATDITNVLPANYSDNIVARFFEKFPKTKYLTANVEPFGTQSSAWWSFWPMNGEQSNLTDEFLAANTARLFSRSLFSPIAYGEVLNELKVALIFIDEPLSVPGMAHFTATKWYESDDLTRFNGNMPSTSDFPLETRDYPYYDKSHKAVIARVQRQIFDVTEVDAPAAPRTSGTAGSSSVSDRQTLLSLYHRASDLANQFQVDIDPDTISYFTTLERQVSANQYLGSPLNC